MELCSGQVWVAYSWVQISLTEVEGCPESLLPKQLEMTFSSGESSPCLSLCSDFPVVFGEGMYLSKLALTFHNLSVYWELWWRGVACRNGEVVIFKIWGLWDFVLMASYSSSSFWLLSVDSASSVNDPWEKLTIFLQLWNHGSCKLVFFSIWNAVIFFQVMWTFSLVVLKLPNRSPSKQLPRCSHSSEGWSQTAWPFLCAPLLSIHVHVWIDQIIQSPVCSVFV